MKRMMLTMVVTVIALPGMLLADDLTKQEQMRVRVQKICPVSGLELGSMGEPVKAQMGDEEMFVCCEGCKGKPANEKHLEAAHANLAKAQGKCPVMNKPLKKGAKSVVVEGRIVFVCCPPCIKKINKDPAKYLAMVDQYYADSLKQDGQHR